MRHPTLSSRAVPFWLKRNPYTEQRPLIQKPRHTLSGNGIPEKSGSNRGPSGRSSFGDTAPGRGLPPIRVQYNRKLMRGTRWIAATPELQLGGMRRWSAESGRALEVCRMGPEASAIVTRGESGGAPLRQRTVSQPDGKRGRAGKRGSDALDRRGIGRESGREAWHESAP